MKKERKRFCMGWKKRSHTKKRGPDGKRKCSQFCGTDDFRGRASLRYPDPNLDLLPHPLNQTEAGRGL